MVTAQQLFGNGNPKDDKKSITARDLFSTSNDKTDLFTSKDNTRNIKESLNDTDRNKFGIVGDVWDSVTGLFGELGDLAEYGWTVATNKNKDWGINDYQKYKEYSTKMSESKSEQEYSNLYQQMVNENVIDEQKYNQYIKNQQNDKDYKFTQAKEEGKNIFNTKIDAELSSVMSQASNRYQIDAISKGIDSIKDQYSMAYENVMNAYKDTRDDRILEEREKTSKQYEKDIIEVTKQRAEEIVKGKTYGDAYSTTIDNFATKKLANEAVNLERSMTNKLYKYTLERNFNDAGEYLSTGNLFQTINSGLLGVKNLITWGLQQVNFGIEEAKQFATDRYDIAEELANVYVFDENASGFTKALGGAKWVGNWVLDSLPNLAPVVGELLLTRKVPGGVLKKLDKAIDGMKLQDGFTRAGFRTFSRITSELTMDNLVYDEAFQLLVGHPITGEEENVNLLFNGIIDSAQAFLHVPAKYFNQTLKKSDVITNAVSQETLNLVRKLEDDAKNLNLVTEGYVLLRGQEITEGTKLNKAANKVKFNLEELEKTNPELVNKIRQIQNEAALYTERMKAYQGKIDDYLLTIEDLKSRKELSNMNNSEKLLEVAEKNIRESKTIRELKDYLLAGAKSTAITFKNALDKGTITEQELRNAIKKFTDVKGFDDLVVGLATKSPIVRDAGIAKIAEEGNNLTRGDINLLYNSAIKDLIESKGDKILDEGEFIGTYKKIGDNRYVDMYGAIDDGKSVYSLDEVLGNISTEINTLSKKSGLMSTVGGDKFLTYDSIARAYEQVNAEVGLKVKTLDDEYDLLPTLQGIGGLNLEGWISKPDAEKSLIKDILSKVGFTVREEDGQLRGIVGTYGWVKKIYNDIKGLSDKNIDDFNEEDVAAYKLLYFGDIYDSFKSYIGRNKMSSPTAKFNASDFQKEFTTFFEKQFDKLPNGKYRIKRAFQNNGDINAMYQSMFAHNATFKEVEEYAATNLIKNILATSVKLGEEDTTLYNKIKGLICKGHYTNGNEREVMPVVNSLFNQAKWLKEMGVSDKGIEQISEVFGELITDPATITSLSLLNSDYLYKGIISRLILGKSDGGAIYKDSLVKLFSQIPENAPAELTNSIKTLSREVEKLTANDIAQADKQVLLNKIQDSFSLSKVRININSQYWTNKFKKGGVEAKGGIFNISKASRLTDDNIEDLSNMLASVIYAKNNLPRNGLLDRLKDGIKKTLENARIQNVKKMQFSIGQTSGISKDGVINLSLLSDVYLMQLLRDPDNVFQMIVGNAMLNKTINDSVNIFEKYKALKDIEIPEDMKKMLNGLQGYIEGGFEKSNTELINDLTKFIKGRGLAHKGNIINKLKSLRDSSMGMSLKDKQQLQNQIDRNINTIDNIINILSIPGNPASANRTAQQLYQTRALLRRGKELLFSKMDEGTFESELSKSLDSVEQFKKMPLSSYDGVVSESPTVSEIWGMKGSTNNLLFDDPLEYKYKAFKGKKLVILDTETTGLDDDAEVIQLAYRILDIDKDGKIKNVTKKSETYKFNQEKMSEWSKNNVIDKGIKEGTKTFKEGKLYNQLQKLAEDKNVYFVGHNLGFDKGRLAYHGIDIGDRNIDTSVLAKALLPVSKNHQQETLTQILEPISNAVNALKGKEGLEGSHHNAEVDVLELQAVLPYLMNHAVKNNKTSEASLLKFMRDTTKKMWKEKDEGIISANALPFYRLEKDWSNIRKTGKKQWFYKSLDDEDSEALFKIGTLTNQMFGGNVTREYIDKAYDALKEKAATNPSKVLNIHDVINTLADKLGDPRAVYALNKLKSKIDIDAVIDTNKVLMGEEVKDAFIKAQDVFPELTFAEYCTNRLVANILSTVGIYNQNTIDSLNKTLLKNVRTASLSKLIDGKNGSSDVEPIMQFIKALGDNKLLNLGEKGSPEYDKAIKDILGQLEDVGTEKETYDTSEKLILKNGGIAKDEVEFVAKDEDGKPLIDLRKEGVSYKVKEFNKALYTFLKKDTEENRLNLENKFNRIIDELFGDEGFLKEYAVGRGYYDIIGESSLPIEESRKITNKSVSELETELKIRENKKEEISKLREQGKAKEAEKLARERYAKMEELKEDIKDAYNKEKGIDVKAEDSEQYREMQRAIDDSEYSDEELYEGEGVLENKLLGDQVIKQNDLSDINQGAAETVNAYGENLKDTSLMFQDLLRDEDFMNTVLKGDILKYNNMFLIDETNESAKNYLKTSYNGIVSTLTIGNEKNKDSLIEFTSKKMNEIQKKIDSLEAQFNSTSKDNKKLREDLQDRAKKLNAVKSYYYNAFSTLNGVRSSTTPQDLIELNGFSKDILGRWTFNGKITGVRMSVKGPDNKEIFNTELFGGRDFDRMAFINSYINAIYKKAQNTGGDGTIDIIYKTEKVDGKESEIIQQIKGEELFNTRVGDYILREFGLGTSKVDYEGGDKVLGALDIINKQLDNYGGDNHKRQKFRIWHLKGKDGPRREWSEQDWIEGLNFTNDAYIYYKHLPEEQQIKYIDTIKKYLDDNDIKYKDFDEDTIRLYLDNQGPIDALDDIIKEAKYDSAGELMYKEVIKPILDRNNDNPLAKEIDVIMRPIVKSDEYKHNVDSKYKTSIAKYNIDTYLSLKSPEYLWESEFEKKLSYEIKNGDKSLRVVGLKQKFYEIEDTRDYDAHGTVLGNTVDVQNKILRGEPVPYEDHMGKDIIGIVEPDIYIVDAEQRNRLLRSLEPSQPRNIFEYVYDDDTTKVLLTDEKGNMYEGILHTEPGSRGIEDGNFTGKAGKMNLTDVKPVNGTDITSTVNEGYWINQEGKLASGLKGEDKRWEEAQKKDRESGQWVSYDNYVENSKASRDVIAQEEQVIKELNKDGDNMDSNMDDIVPYMKREGEIWNTRILNFTNYDLYNKSEAIQQIVGRRQRLLGFKKELRDAIDRFNKSIEGLSDESKREVYRRIRERANTVIHGTEDVKIGEKSKTGAADMLVDGISKETQKELFAIGDVFEKAGRDPQYQFAMLSFKNDGFEGILKNIAHNHKGASADYFKATGENLEKAITNEVSRWFKGQKDIKHAVEDILGDPLGTGAMFKAATGVRSLWRFIKYGPIVFPLSGVLMLANSAILGITRYASESSGFRRIMNSDAFNILIAKKGDILQLSNGKHVEGLGFTDGINRVDEVMFNSNSDLGGSWFDKCLDWMLNKIPENNGFMKRTKEILITAMKGGTHSLFDLFAQGAVKTMELAKSLEKNLPAGMNINEFVARLQAGNIDSKLVNKILADTEKGYSRFFTNSATSLFSRHKFSRWYMFNALQGYVINRTDEVFSSIKDCVNWIGRQQALYNRNGGKGIAFNWKDFVNYINTDNQELKGLLMNVLLSAKLGFYMDRLVNGGDFSGKEYSDYMIDTSDYLSSLPATFFYGILTAPISGIEDYAEYVKMNNEDFNIGNGLTVAGLNTVSQVMSKFFREGKVLNAFMDSIVAYGKTGDIDFAYDVLEREFSDIANGLGRFQLVEGTNKYGLDNLTSESDMLGQILFNADKVSESGKLTNNLYSLQTVDSILNGENGDYWKNRLLPYIPLIGNILQNSITGTGYTFTSAKWKELQHIMDKDGVVQILNNWDYDKMQDYQGLWWDEGIYTNEAVGRMYKELTAFNYPYKGRKNGTEFKTGYEGELEQIKETVFTDELMRGLGWTEEDLTNYLNQTSDRKKAGLMKIMAASEAARPGSSKIVLSYLANQEEYELLKKVTGKDYPSSTDVTDEEMATIQRQVLQDYYPYMFTADKTSWYRAITEYVSNKYDLFKDLYKDDDLTGYLSTLGYMDMIMYQQAKTGNVNAKFIKNTWSMLAKYMKSEPARMNAISYINNTINNSNFSKGKATSAKMGVFAANMDFYDKIQKNGMMQALYGEDIERYNNFVWGVLKDLGDIDWSDKSRKSPGKGYKKGYNNYNPIGDNNTPTAQQFIPRAQKYLKGRTPSFGGKSGYNPNSTYKPGKTLDWYWKYYEALIKVYSDRLVKSTGKKYPAETVESITFKTGSNNKGTIKGKQLEFPKHKSKEYRTKLFSNLPGSHG